MPYKQDIIIALATPLTTTALAIIRISGKNCWQLGKNIFLNKNKTKKNFPQSWKLYPGKIFHPQNKTILDEVLIAFYPEKRSYSGEEMVEIFCHGGVANIKNILDLLLQYNTRLAKPGEFTQRAFLNGKLDLVQAESIAAITSAENLAFLQAAQNNLQGKFGEKIKEIKNILIKLVSELEVIFDYPNEDLEELNKNNILKQVNILREKIKYLIEIFSSQNENLSSIKSVICGKPNVGKSSIFNFLLGEEKALVTSISGTTRDSLEGFLELKNISFHLFDTAGIRKTKNKIELLGIKKTQAVIENAKLILLVLDGYKGFDFQDEYLIKTLKNKDIIILLNKKDIEKFKLKEANSFLKKQNLKKFKLFSVSAKTGEGFKEFQNYLLKKYSPKFRDDNFLINLRQKQLLEKSLKCLEQAKKQINKNILLDIICEDLKNSLYLIGEITGENISEEVISSIFKNFCIGK